MSTLRLDGTLFERLVIGGMASLGANTDVVNDLNVFPIPDGDTGDNMMLTISGGVHGMAGGAASLSEASRRLADGMLLSARGNSGVSGLRRSRSSPSESEAQRSNSEWTRKIKIVLFIMAAVAAYLIGSINPAIIISNKLYKTDVRQHGSRNAGFTNFKRVLGSQNAWYVLMWDMVKSAVLCALFGWLFHRLIGFYHLGAAYVIFFAMLGHAYPVWYDFRGGKGVAVFAAAIWFIDWRAGLVALFLLVALLATFQYMSLAVLVAAASCPVTLALVGVEHSGVQILTTLSVLFLFWRHRENIDRLRKGTESKFTLGSFFSPISSNAFFAA